MKLPSQTTRQLKRLLERIECQGLNETRGQNVIAFSGGVDSSLVAAAVYLVFPRNTKCVIGKSQSLPSSQLSLARNVATYIGVPLVEVATREGENEEYIKNEGMSCYSCKTHLYSALKDVQQYIRDSSPSSGDLMLFNGTNKDDLKDDTRVGLKAAKEFLVSSPLDELIKDEVRSIARELGLPNHSHAASPCLRSRLAFGVHATPDNLLRIEAAENIVRTTITHDVVHNIRVRHLRDGGARIELDAELLSKSSNELPVLADRISELGFKYVKFDSFKSGSVAARILST